LLRSSNGECCLFLFRLWTHLFSKFDSFSKIGRNFEKVQYFEKTSLFEIIDQFRKFSLNSKIEAFRNNSNEAVDESIPHSMTLPLHLSGPPFPSKRCLVRSSRLASSPLRPARPPLTGCPGTARSLEAHDRHVNLKAFRCFAQ
jgi:hypothetical protein